MGILGSQDIVLIVCSLGSGKVCGPTEVVYLSRALMMNKSLISRGRCGEIFQRHGIAQVKTTNMIQAIVWKLLVAKYGSIMDISI